MAKRERRMLMTERIEEKMIEFERAGSESGDDNDTCEEWERHEAMYDDVTNQGRNKDRLFEEEMEVVWEKGGSGLVFYTDAQYWHEQEGDFDEQTTDDLNVDMSAYYEDGALFARSRHCIVALPGPKTLCTTRCSTCLGQRHYALLAVVSAWAKDTMHYLL